ncbi:MAG TPA: hypothetical protein VF613_14905 [Longimicrobium sp.]|jgi:hypothetical protein
MKTTKLSLSALLALAAILSVSPADAQGKGNDKHDRPRQEARRDDDRERERRDDRWERERREGTRFERRESRRSVPRGWCQGRGNPHNTAANCGYRGDLDRVYRDRDGVLRDRNGRVIRSDGSVYDDRANRNGGYNGSYETAHAEYHRWHDQQCRDRASQAGGVTGRLRVAAQCKGEHDAWHRQQGTSHR